MKRDLLGMWLLLAEWQTAMDAGDFDQAARKVEEVKAMAKAGFDKLVAPRLGTTPGLWTMQLSHALRQTTLLGRTGADPKQLAALRKDIDERAAWLHTLLEHYPTDAASEKVEEADPREWPKERRETAIRQYLGRRSRQFNAFKLAVSRGHAKAKKDARKTFGRNIIAARLGMPRASVSATEAWREIKEALFPDVLPPNEDYYTDVPDDMKAERRKDYDEYTRMRIWANEEARVLDRFRPLVADLSPRAQKRAEQLLKELELGILTPQQAEEKLTALFGGQ